MISYAVRQLDSWIHQCFCSAIRDSQQPISPIGFLFLKLPPPPPAVLLAIILYMTHSHYSQVVYRISYPPTPLPGLRGRRKGSGKGSAKHRFGVPVTAPHHWPACAYFWHALASLSCFWRACEELHIQVAQCFLWRFRRCSFGSWIHSAAQGRYTSTHQPITSTHQPIQGQSFHHHPPIHLFAFSWFEGAETAPGPQTNGPPLGPESCWGSAGPRRCSRIHGAAQGHGQSFHPIPPPSIHPSISLCF